ncbi:MAG TPA: NYN domain-containing protein [Pyrinomonadaceae bacterium]|nr:NYN domain-containing protein [Pyrinomonadaceae bacterium]
MNVTRGKTICFIDNANIFHGQQDAGWRIDWRKFVEHLARDGEVWQTYFFASVANPPRPEEEAFFDFLKEQLRWEVMAYSLGKRTVCCTNCRFTETVPAEKGVDVGLATKMLMLGMNQAYETAVLVAGDRDYLETVVFLKGLGLRVEVVAWRDNLSDLLASESSAPVLYHDTLKAEIEKRP